MESQKLSVPLTSQQVAELRKIDTPTICNLLEMVVPHRRGFGFTTKHMYCAFPNLPPVVGYAKTATIRARDAGLLGPDDYMALRFKYFDYLAAGPQPRISVVEDLDGAEAGFGSYWGEVNSNIHKALGCIGAVTNGSVRDLDAIAENFQLLSGIVGPSHAFVHLVDFGDEVNVFGMIVRSGDLVHADKHGAVVIPLDVADKVAAALDLMRRREAVILTAARDPQFTIDKLKGALRESAQIKQ